MKSSLGKTLRKIRIGKNVRLTSLANSSLSKSQISRFERGESEISCIRLLNLLDQLNVSLDEFLIIHNDSFNEKKNFVSLIQYIKQIYTSENVDTLKELLKDNQAFQIGPLEITMIKSIIYTFDNSVFPSETELMMLLDYLFKVDKWGYYEIVLLGNCVRTINYTSFYLLTKEMIKNFINSDLNKSNKKLVVQLTINCLILSIDNNEFKKCVFLINKIEKLLQNELEYFEKTIFLYVRGYFEYKKGCPTGIKKMEDAINIFDSLEDYQMKKRYSYHFNNVVIE